MEERRCAACGEAFRPCPRVRDQQYCGKEDCRRARRRRWQRAKRQADADYADNQVRAQRAWARENSAYWQAYRSEHPEYAQADRERARKQQRNRRQQKAAGASTFAKMDSIGPFSSVPPGTYLLVPQGGEEFAKMDSIMVKLTLLSKE
jgi:hypothetical protein